MRKSLLILFVLTLWTTALFAQGTGQTISGRVTDMQEQPVAGATVVVKENPTVGTSTGSDGKFTLALPRKNCTLIVSFIGYTSKEVPVAGQTSVEIKLAEDVQTLDDVVVVGYGTQKRANLTGAVATVDVEKAIGSRPVTDLARGLQGVAPGLMVSTSSGNIGTAAQIHIRGIQGSTNAEAKPLILLDNVEIDNLMMVNPSDVESISILKDAASSSIYGVRGAWGVILITSKKGVKGKPRLSYDNSFAWSSPMNTPEIADGALGAEYMLAAYRRTAPNQESFNILGAYYDDQSIQRMRQWKQLYGGKNLGDEMVAGRDYEIRGGKPYFYRAWDVDDIFLNNASMQQKHNLSISGATDKVSYFGSFGVLDQRGLVSATPSPDRFLRFSGNLRLEAKVTKFLTVRGSIMVTNSDRDYPNFRLANAASGANEYWFNIYRYPETYPYGTIGGKPLKNIRSELEQAHMNNTLSTMSRFNIGSTITLAKGWTTDVDYSYISNNSHQKLAATPISGINHWSDPTFSKYETSFFPAEDYVSVKSTWAFRNVGKAYTTYSKTIGDHTFKVMAGMDIEYFRNDFQSSKRYGLYDASKPELILTDSDIQETSGYPTHWSTFGFFGRVNYNYKDKYLVEFNIRRDGSSRFNDDYKWCTFPSVSAGYVLTSEKFMETFMEKSRLSFFKLRASWGQIGNNNLGSYSYQSLISAGKSNWFLGTTNALQFSTPSVAAPHLTWEPIETIDVGADIRFFDNSLSFEFDWFNRTTRNMAASGEEVPASMGSNAPARNFGKLVTKGWELSVGYNKRFGEHWSVNLLATLSDQTGKIVDHANKEISIKNGGNGFDNYAGKNIGEIWGYDSDRLFTEDDFDGNNGEANPTWYYKLQTANQDELNSANAFHYGPGDVKYRDLNGDGVVNFGAGTNKDPGDMRVIGNTTPRYIYGLRLGFSWKNFDFSAFMQGVGKRDYWGTGSIFAPGFTMGEAVYQNQATNYWTPQRPNALYPRPSNIGSNTHNGNWQCQTRYLLDMAYARMKNITIGYTLPQKWMRKLHISSARVFVSGENLFTIDNLDITIDPEIQQNEVEGFSDAKSFGRTYPYFRTWSFGLQINL